MPIILLDDASVGVQVCRMIFMGTLPHGLALAIVHLSLTLGQTTTAEHVFLNAHRLQITMQTIAQVDVDITVPMAHMPILQQEDVFKRAQ
jgi:hypothetical protein